jgi:hypothetical protein
MFYLEHLTNHPEAILDIGPVEDYVEVPSWMPAEYHSAYQEMLDNMNRAKYRSVVGIASVILDAFIASLLPNEGDRKKPLYQKIDAAMNLGKIDRDQFSDATVARLTRNDVLHPETILEAVDAQEAQEIVDSVSGLLERAFKFRSSRALPAPRSVMEEDA